MKSYKEYIDYDKKLYDKYNKKLNNHELVLYNCGNIDNKNISYGFGGFCKYATKKENDLLDKLWNKHLEKLSLL